MKLFHGSCNANMNLVDLVVILGMIRMFCILLVLFKSWRYLIKYMSLTLTWCQILDIAGLQNEDGSFSGDIWGEVDTRFSYISILSLALLHRLDKVDVGKAVKYILSCKNVDGGFGCTPGAESHAGQSMSHIESMHFIILPMASN
ncbi:hypothetical protein AABB24_027154 [Solanum stoloniferum]|uniref:Geranylgeranyl transferase type II subunit beta n=1 Tax=Solanum stoloniferum TaxID=62892 RepID=A0ABD2SHY8_9SOLN